MEDRGEVCRLEVAALFRWGPAVSVQRIAEWILANGQKEAQADAWLLAVEWRGAGGRHRLHPDTAFTPSDLNRVAAFHWLSPEEWAKLPESGRRGEDIWQPSLSLQLKEGLGHDNLCICPLCQGEGHIVCKECAGSGECSKCSGKGAGKCGECKGTGHCWDCEGGKVFGCHACQGEGLQDPRVLWWNAFQDDVEDGNIEKLMNDHMTLFPLVKPEDRQAIFDEMEYTLTTEGYPWLEKITQWSREHLP